MRELANVTGQQRAAFRALLVFLVLALMGCELVADFDRSKIPLPDAGATDAAAPRPDSGEPPEEDAGDEADAG
jgi:hypothetical protein